MFLKLTCHMSSLKDNEKILNYNDVILRRSDLDILSGPHFLNDRIIELYFSYLASCYHSKDILLVPPSISFWLTNCPELESLKDFTEPLKLPDKKLIILVVNNNDEVTMAEGGTHWSLLAYERSTNTFVHHDSIAGSNSLHAKRLRKALLGFIGSSCSETDGRYLEYTDTPQQTNGYDCGLYVLAIAKVICHWHESAGSKDNVALWFSTLKEQVVPSAVAKMRNEILSLIKDLMLKN
ncbi:NEDD8-specific protease 1 [Telopea speciosissima]|uniref:NEDD8-specific protease 1 n=1 Tax=Telopea speciosissima TaxID=54955 RepID=UPI001CC453DF|nr:NEDD8-specific protease 1 [Telopea speciosissima]